MNRIKAIDAQFGLVHDCIRACVYADHIDRITHKKDAWLSLGSICYAEAIITWNHIFGANSQKSHWKRFTKLVPVPEGSRLKPFGPQVIACYLDIPVETWASYHASLVSVRNDLLAHFDHESKMGQLSNLTWAMHSAYLYRSWLISLLNEYCSRGCNIKVTSELGPEILDIFQRQISEVCQ